MTTLSPANLQKLILELILELKSPSGSSVPTLVKGVVARVGDESPDAKKDWTKKLGRSLKKLLAEGKVVKVKQSYKLPGVEFVDESSAGLEIIDVKVGSGLEVQAGSTVKVGYEGKLENEAGATFDKAGNFEFTVGIGEVIKGWDVGLLNMKVGGTRKLIVPSKLGYGKRGSGKEIPPNSNLFFTITLKSLTNP